MLLLFVLISDKAQLANSVLINCAIKCHFCNIMTQLNSGSKCSEQEALNVHFLSADDPLVAISVRDKNKNKILKELNAGAGKKKGQVAVDRETKAEAAAAAPLRNQPASRGHSRSKAEVQPRAAPHGRWRA